MRERLFISCAIRLCHVWTKKNCLFSDTLSVFAIRWDNVCARLISKRCTNNRRPNRITERMIKLNFQWVYLQLIRWLRAVSSWNTCVAGRTVALCMLYSYCEHHNSVSTFTTVKRVLRCEFDVRVVNWISSPFILIRWQIGIIKKAFDSMNIALAIKIIHLV